ncbi:distal membrane-arm assembly complex protein 2 [Adelges cooleyi]|uniref:distal membrane-arm assembly complex protein 2 n=1 Tax=Adelges cooleyi TaxID=133065 RepID=UPI00217FAD15|nr:distal membrane-arm assembly complex protein 2 [Adelges cooleyi]
MNNLRRLFLSNKCPLTYGIKRYSNRENALTENEKTKLYERLMGSRHNEKKTEVSSFRSWLVPGDDYGPPRLLNYDWTMKTIAKWYYRKTIEFQKYSQRYIPDRVKALGSDIAIAHYIVYRGGAVKFRDHDDFIRWENKKDDYFVNLPQTYESNYFVEAVDASDMVIYYEGLENFKNLYKLKWLSFKNNPVLDDWGLDYIGSTIPNLEYLDITNCKQITANGICGLHKSTQLKQLVVNNEDIEFQMACFALEDIIPGLSVSTPSIENENTQKENLEKV